MTQDLFSLDSYQYELPPELIAHDPCTPRDHSRLMVVDRRSGQIEEMKFHELKYFLEAGDSLVFNDTKVIPARLFGERLQGGKAEIVLIKRLSIDTWEVLARPGKKMQPGSHIRFGENFACQVLDILPEGGRVVRFMYEGSFEEVLALHGQLPLPPYISRNGAPKETDQEMYQTVYAAHPGAVAAPTAGLHFTQDLLHHLKEKGVKQNTLTLHVGLGTFKPVQAEDIRLHPMHAESVVITPQTAKELNNRSRHSRQICVGTTSCRALESAADLEGKIIAGTYETSLFIYPGYTFKYVQGLLTNFHFPKSTLLMLVCAFAGYELIMKAYQMAIQKRFRFYSYGDAMLIL